MEITEPMVAALADLIAERTDLDRQICILIARDGLEVVAKMVHPGKDYGHKPKAEIRGVDGDIHDIIDPQE